MQLPRIAVFPKAYMEELSTGKMDLMEWIDLASTLGADGLELYPLFFRQTDQSYLNTVIDKAASYNLTIPMMCASPDFTHPESTFRAKEIDKMKRMIDLMAAIGPSDFRSCRVLSGQRRPEVSREDGIRYTVESIRALLPYAEQHQVHLVMENHYKDGFWIYPEFAQSLDVFLEITQQISSPWFGINYDPSNALVAGQDPLAVLAQVKSRVLTMHASDRYLKDGYTWESVTSHEMEGYSQALAHGVIGKGMNDYDAIFSQLAEVDFDGWISVEDGLNGLDEMRQSVTFLKQSVAKHFQHTTQA
ncbi:sugar phosphate isomerase/epimerase family protein [Alicyclobacillus fodiniaquatilis]|uniref:Sugar phosphate isomerase/epimerase family protein n=1 Tax=Alicyclobacillus fodiniaquatilis TaxID=1661150 RepID=A0ABW4JEL5_9BACL